jgi:phosphatidylinositol alpha-1,6-mannosyltransferase
MQLVVTSEARFQRTPDGAIWCTSHFPYPYEFWTRYLSVYTSVILLARVQDVASVEAKAERVDGANISVHALPYYVGPLAYLTHFFSLRRSIMAVIQAERRYILRLGSPIGDILYKFLKKQNLKYGVEVVGDPWDMFAPGGIKHPLRPFLRLWFVYVLKRECRDAFVASYVTERLLQQRYPPKKAALTIHASSIVLGDEAYAANPRVYEKKSSYSLVLVGSLEHAHKGVDLLIEALALLQKRNLQVTATVVGQGKMKDDFVKLAHSLGVSELIKFPGIVNAGEGVRNVLKAHDIFILPSRADGMPRAMIEAMALGMFCLGARVGGMQELIPSELLIHEHSGTALANLIEKAITHTELMNDEAAKNLAKAREFHKDVLAARRKSLYLKLKEG